MDVLKPYFLFFLIFALTPIEALSYKEKVAALFSNDLSPAVSIRPRLGDRFYIRSVLINIFGPDSSERVNKIVFEDPSIFGGNCDPYELSSCPQTFNAELGQSSVVRQAKMLQACEVLVKDPKTLSFSLSHFLLDKKHEVNRKNIAIAFSAFNFERVAPEPVLESLNSIDQNVADEKLRWQKILFVLCSDPGWQIL